MFTETLVHGGWGAILIYKENHKEISGYQPNTTNNAMEITAVLEAVKLLKFPCELTIYSDSAYVVNCFEKGWMDQWQKNHWKNSSKQAVKNQDLWKELYQLLQKHQYQFVKVKGHSDNEWNNRCDALATNQIKENTQSQNGSLK